MWSLDDTRQVATFSIWQSIERGVRDVSLLACIARRDVIDEQRVFAGKGAMRSRLWDVPPVTLNGDALLERAESHEGFAVCDARDELQKVRARLTKQEWQAVWMRFGIGRQGKEVANAMRVSESRVSQMLYRAARKLGIVTFMAVAGCAAVDPVVVEGLRLAQATTRAVSEIPLHLPARKVELGGGVRGPDGVMPILRVDRPVLGHRWTADIQWRGWYRGPGALLVVGQVTPGTTHQGWMVEPQAIYGMPDYMIEVEALPSSPFDLCVQAVVVVDYEPWLLATPAVRLRGGTR